MRFKTAVSPVLGSFIASAGMQLAIAALSLISGPMQARGLGSDGRGQLAVVLIIGQIASMAVDLGTGGYLIRERANGMTRSELIGSIIPIMLFSILGAIALSWPIALAFSRHNGLLETMIIVQFMLMPLVVISQVGTSIALGEGSMKTVIIIRLSAAVVPVLGLTILFFSGALTLETACFCYFAGSLASALAALSIWITSLPLTRDPAITKQAWKFGSTSMLTMILSLGNVRADALIVAKSMSFHDAGLYVVASTLAGLPMMLANAAMQSRARRLSLDGLGQETARASSLVSASVILTAFVVAALSPLILPTLFGREFAQSISITWVLLFGTVFGANANFLSIATTLAGSPKVAAVAQFAGIVSMIIAMPILSRYEGVLGAAAGSSIGYAVTFAVLVGQAQRRSGVSWYKYVIPSVSSISVVARHIRY